MTPRLLLIVLLDAVAAGAIVSAVWVASQMRGTRQGSGRFLAATVALVGLLAVGALLGNVWMMLVPFALAAGWAVWSIVNTAARNRLGDQLLAAGIYPSWMPWTCPRCHDDCRESLYPCPEAVALLHPTTDPEERDR